MFGQPPRLNPQAVRLHFGPRAYRPKTGEEIEWHEKKFAEQRVEARGFLYGFIAATILVGLIGAAFYFWAK